MLDPKLRGLSAATMWQIDEKYIYLEAAHSWEQTWPKSQGHWPNQAAQTRLLPCLHDSIRANNPDI